MSVKVSEPSGLLVINKPKGITSHDAVVRIRRLTGQRRAGHAGTLDPMASGLLLVCLGQATRLIEYLMAGRKQYRATVRFGIATDTHDAEGKIIDKSDPSGLTEAQLQKILPTFQGTIEQIPPIFSALKKDGQPLYKRARAGQTIEVEPRQVKIDALNLVAWQPPDLVLEIICSPGMYVRSLARDLGEVVGSGAHLTELTRTNSGAWSLDDAVSLGKLEYEAVEDEASWLKYFHPPDRAVSHLPCVTLDEQAASRVSHGQRIRLETIDSGLSQAQSENVELVRAYTPAGGFLAILTLAEPNDKLWHPKKVFYTR